MVRGVEKGSELAGLIEAADVVVAGTGLGESAWAEKMARTCLGSPAPVVMDADGLNLLARMGPESTRLLAGQWIITPHPAEAARLLACPSGQVQADRVGAALELAERFQAVTVLKGCGTVVTAPDGRYAICPFGNPGMATAGSGDVLAGVIGAMVAQGVKDLWAAAIAGVLAHALAGDLVAAEQGERGMLASDITRRLPRILNPSQ